MNTNGKVTLHTQAGILVPAWTHCLPHKHVKFGLHGVRLGNINQPYSRVKYNLPVPGWDLDHYQMIECIDEYNNARAYIVKPSPDIDKVAEVGICRLKVLKNSAGLPMTLLLSGKALTEFSELGLDKGEQECVIWDRMTGVTSSFYQQIAFVSTDKTPGFIIDDLRPRTTLDYVTSEINGAFKSLFSSLTGLDYVQPDNDGLYISSSGRRFVKQEYANHPELADWWEIKEGRTFLGQHKEQGVGLSWRMLCEVLPDSEFPLHYLGELVHPAPEASES